MLNVFNDIEEWVGRIGDPGLPVVRHPAMSQGRANALCHRSNTDMTSFELLRWLPRGRDRRRPDISLALSDERLPTALVFQP